MFAVRSGSSASVRTSPPPGSVTLLDAAVEHLMLRKDFHAAFETCENGLQGLFASDELEEPCSRPGELKSALCVVGIQALAELNQWRDVLAWVSRHYGEAEKIPAKIMQMCILLYSKVAKPAAIQDEVCSWLHCPNNMSQSGYSSVAELYILHVLLPLDKTADAKQLLEDEVGRVAFTEDQRQTALSIVEDHISKTQTPPNPDPEHVSVEAKAVTTQLGSLVQRLKAVMRWLYRSLSLATNFRSRSLRRAALFLFLLYLLLVRIDPSLPPALPWILRLYGLIQHMWKAMFAPHYAAVF